MTMAPGRKLSFGTIMAYSQFGLPLAVAYLPLNLYLTRFYAGDLMFDVAVVGIVLMIARAADFIVDPLIGALSDRVGQRFGRRRLWTALSVPLLVAGTYMTFFPQAGAGPVYLLIWVSLLYFGWTMATIAYGAWGAELSDNYAERTRITGVREMFALLGVLAASLAPLYTGGGPGSPLGFAPLMAGLGWLVIVAAPLSLIIMMWRVPEPEIAASGRVSWLKGLQIAARNGPFMRILGANFISRIGTAANLAVVIWFFEQGLALGPYAGFPLLVWLLTAIFGTPVWIVIGERMMKHKAIIIASFFSIASFSALFMVPPGDLMLTCIVMAVAGLSGAASAAISPAIAADVIDLDSLRSKEARAGLLLAFWGMAQKGADALGVGIALVLLGGVFGFQANATNTPEALFGLKLVYIVLPAVFWIGSVAFLWNFPITPDKQRRIRALLERKKARRLAAIEVAAISPPI